MTFPASALPVSVHIAPGADLTADPATWSWTEVTSYVYVRDGIHIARGRPDEFSQTPPSTLALTVDNRDGRWSPRNPTGAWYGQIGRNTPVRVTVAEGSTSRRFTGFISELPPRWDPSGADRYVPLRADGVLRRLGQRSSPQRSVLTRAVLAAAPVAYWPCEDESGAAHLAPAVGDHPMRYAGTLSIGATGPAGSVSAVELADDTQLHAVVDTIPHSAETAGWTVALVVNVPAAVTARTVLHAWSTSGDVLVWLLVLTPGSPDTLSLELYEGGALTQTVSMNFTAGTISEPYGRDLLVAVAAATAFTNTDLTVSVRTVDLDTSSVDDVAAGVVAGKVMTVAMYPSASLDGAVAGHFAVWDGPVDATTLDGIAALLEGGDGESAIARATRLGGEHGVTVSDDLGSGTYDATVRAMGPLGTGGLVDGLREAEAVDGGMLVELREADGDGALLTLRSAVALYNRSVDLTLDYDSGEVAPPFEPAGDDDQATINDFTASRTGGSSSRYVDADHVDRYGTYDSSTSYNVHSDDQLPGLASWQVHLGTVDEQRYPRVTVALHSSPSLISSWIACDIGSRVQITNPPDGLPPDTIDLLIQGYTEVITPFTWTVELNCTPCSPWLVGEWDGTASRWSPDSCVLAEALDTTETAIDVTTEPLWSTSASGFDIWVGGERMTVSAVAGASNPQTLTVTRSVNEVVKSHSSGAEVRLWQPAVWAR